MFKHYFELVENVSVWPVISLTIFFGFFILMILWLFKVDKKYIKRMKNLPLDDDTKTGSSKSQIFGIDIFDPPWHLSQPLLRMQLVPVWISRPWFHSWH